MSAAQDQIDLHREMRRQYMTATIRERLTAALDGPAGQEMLTRYAVAYLLDYHDPHHPETGHRDRARKTLLDYLMFTVAPINEGQG